MSANLKAAKAGMTPDVFSDDFIDLELPKNPVWVSVARLAAAAIAYRAGMPFDTIEDIKVIVAEAVSYAIQYGAPQGRLHLRFDLSHDHLDITLTDPTFPLKLPRDRNGASYKTFVDGLFLIRGLADEVDFDATPGGGLTLRIRRGA
ncbi:MAG: ATP-binding protein [Candidatus Eremiobacteraeota bacterium]|nr:ATP-binding protein [Candidatus Eremiobacteraeota bacterium]